MSYTVRFNDGDIEFGSGGDQIMVTGAEKAAQDLLDEVLLPYDAATDSGNEMFEADGSFSAVASSPSVGTSYINTCLRSAAARLMRKQAASSGTDADEVIRKVNNVVVRPIAGDATSYAFLLAVESNSRKIALARAISMKHTGTLRVDSLG